MISENEHNYHRKSQELYAAIRPERPPEVTSVPYPQKRPAPQEIVKEKPKRVIIRKATTRKHLEELKPQNQASNDARIAHNIEEQAQEEMETDLPIEPVEQTKAKRRTVKRSPPDINYDIVSDVLDKTANITIRDLIKVANPLRKQLNDASKIKRKPAKPTENKNTVAFIEDEDLNTTAAYTKIQIGRKKITVLVDCGAAKTCMSKALADELGLEIDAPSQSIFTLGNGTKQPALGIIYDVPVKVADNLTIPISVEVLPTCPSHFILGNNWFNRAKARIDFNKATLKVTYKNKTAELDITFLRKNETPKVNSYQQTYQNPVCSTNNKLAKDSMDDEDERSDYASETSSSEDESEQSLSSDDDEVEEELNAEMKQDQLLLPLQEEEKNEVNVTELHDEYVLAAGNQGLIIPANEVKTISFKKNIEDSKDMKYDFDITNIQIQNMLGYFDISTVMTEYRKSIEVRLFNRSNTLVILRPNEEIGRINKYDPKEGHIVKAYDIKQHPDLFLMEKTESSNNNEEENSVNPELLDKLDIGSLPKGIKLKLRRLLTKYNDIFDWDNNTIGRTDLITHKIIIDQDTQPISHRPYRLSPIESRYLEKELDKYSKLGVISPSNSPWAAPVILVKKKNGEYRMVIDYRKLNAITKKDSYPLPRIDDLLDTLGKASVFSALDMRAGFHQVPLDDDSKELTAFTTKFGVYHYNALPMGLVNSPATFQRLIDLCFRPLLNKCLVAYIDDLNVYSSNYHEHLQHLEQVFNCIKIAKLRLNPEKCFFFKDHLKFLGYIITKEGIQTDPSKIEKIANYPIPKTIKQVRGFLGLASYYRRFIKNFAAIARPLHDQTKTTKQIPWTNKTTEAFNKLKELLTTSPVLARPDFNKPFILVTDASKLGLGCILTQLDDNGHEHPIVFASRSLRSSEYNYAATKLECLAVIWSVKLFRPYLLGQPFTIITDHSALKGLLDTKNPTGIIARWITVLAEYTFDIKYRPGRINESADFMSRLGY